MISAFNPPQSWLITANLISIFQLSQEKKKQINLDLLSTSVTPDDQLEHPCGIEINPCIFNTNQYQHAYCVNTAFKLCLGPGHTNVPSISQCCSDEAFPCRTPFALDAATFWVMEPLSRLGCDTRASRCNHSQPARRGCSRLWVHANWDFGQLEIQLWSRTTG